MSLRKIKGTVVVRLVDVLDKRSLAMHDHPVMDPYPHPHHDQRISDGSIYNYVSNSYVLALQASIQLISATKADFSEKGKLGNTVHLDGVVENATVEDAPYTFITYFDYDKNFGIPGAFYIKNLSTLETEFFLVSLTLDGIPNHPPIHFVCNSWIYDAKKYQTDRIFFTNDTYLPSKTPPLLAYYRQLELQTLRGDGKGERKEWERIYDYDVYNDLGDPDNGKYYERPIAGGSSDYPYPRRGRTGRKPTKTDPKSESRSNYVYIPRDEVAVELQFTKSLVNRLKSVSENAIPGLQSALKGSTSEEFHSFDDVFGLFEGGKFPFPKVIEASKIAWQSDEEFAREIIAGVNPVLIRCLHEFPPKSKLDSRVYGDHTSKITTGHLIHDFHASYTIDIDKAIRNKELFILDHHDTIFPYLRKINSTSTKAYASRTIFRLKRDGTLTPLAIELSLPHPAGDQFGPVSHVYLPETEGVKSSLWLLAKAYVIVNDTCFHQLISHWLHTHAVVEPFSIATNRQLSVVHPIYKLLHPHFRNTMNINAAARNVLVNAGGIIENTFLWGRYAVEMSSIMYKDWVFPEQALPSDLLKRGMAVEDPTSPVGVRLVIKDYPYATDGLDIWHAIRTWVQEYVSLYYTSDDTVQQDSELQSWWKEVVEVGHGDKKDETWWPKMKTVEELNQACTIIIWTSSALHAAVNFGQYPYGGLILNRPTLSRQLMPKEGTHEFNELEKNPQDVYLKTITPKPLSIIDLRTLEILSTHSSDEYYLGQRESVEYWTSDTKALEAFKKFGTTLAGIEEQFIRRNKDKTLKNRVGPVSMPYTLLYPSSEEGLTFRGIPNSVSI